MGLFLPQASVPHFILGHINKAFPLYSTVTKYGEEMTNGLFPFIKLEHTTALSAYAHSHKHSLIVAPCLISLW